MRRTLILLGTALLVFLCTSAGYSAEQAPQKVIDLANSTLAAFGTDATIVKAVMEENAKGKTLEQIQAKDKEWMANAGIADYMTALMESETGKYLRTIQAGAPYYAEIFVMDNLGANVTMTDKTSDYWQGDEAKFKKSFADGAGAVFVDAVKYDDSSQTYLVQVSVPVMDGDKAIGAITFGIDIDKIE